MPNTVPGAGDTPVDEKVTHGAYIPLRATASDQGNKKVTSFGDEKCCEEDKRGLHSGSRLGGLLCLRHSQGRPPRGGGICVDLKKECSKQKALREKPLKLKIIFFFLGNSLVIQWLRLHLATQGRDISLIADLGRPHMPCAPSN